ncbi:unnamed protein product [Rotaria magnacalcarata]|uniref:Uncharacterized protein n=1 Tax=Rotaria magnacalcarata TaxID=392030 RepID=A0A816CKG7_9BILA|nr:unnamed protein product [Rotaria magnacalcarata]CAF1626131.1 unnamed protein product [Rotaria magnacalcarata]CAF2192948.1 unnamed protein product [Rotaria magnacalcarata]CAF4009482.1 unnamed protein product [Rotaria magnacalcarata]CAF4015284.1 unnamed protein product [Rotaria magnacalcarata]
MTARFDPNTEQVFYSSGISQVMEQEYSSIFSLMQQELESTAAYLDLKSAMRSNQFRPQLLRSNMNEAMQNIVRTVDEQLADLPADARQKIGKAITEKCFNVAPSLAAVPPGRSCMVASRVNGIDDHNSNTYIWSCGFDLSLSEGESSSSRSPSKGSRYETELSSRSSSKGVYRLEGTLNIVVLCCRRQAIDNLEKLAKRDPDGTKRQILHQCPRPSLFPFGQNSLHGSTSSTMTNGLQASQMSASNNNSINSNSSKSDDRKALQFFMGNRADWAVTILRIKELRNASLPSGAIDMLLHEIKDAITQDYRVPNTYIFLNHVVVVYPSHNITEITGVMRMFDKNGGTFWLATAQVSQLKNSVDIIQIKLTSASIDNVIEKIQAMADGKASNSP